MNDETGQTAPERDAVVALVACPVEQADRLAGLLVEQQHAACVNIVPAVRSVYVWDGAVQRDDEALLVIKTTVDRVGPIDAVLAEHHPYDVYELITLPITSGNADYLAWLHAT